MNELYSIALLTCVELVGISFITFFKINPRLNIWLSFILGLFLIVQTSLLSLFCINTISNLAFIVLAFIALLAIFINKKKIVFLLSIKNLRIDFLILLSFIVLVTIKPNYIGITADSVHYFVASDAIFNNILTRDMLDNFSWYYANGRLIFLDILILLGFVFDIDLIVYLLPLLGLVSIMFILRLLGLKYSLNYFQQGFLFSTLLIFSISIDRFFSHTHYLHSNLLTGVYYCFGVLMLTLNKPKEKENLSSYIGVLFLGATILIRKEMLLYSLMPIIFYLFFKKSRITESMSYIFLYLIIGYQWIVYYIVKTGHLELDLNTLFYSGHGGVQDYFYWFILSVVMPFALILIKKLVSRQSGDIFFYISYLFILLVLLGVNYDETISTIVKLFGHSLLKIGAWGFYWFALFLSMLYCFKNRINQYLIHIVLSFLVARIGIYVVYDDIIDYGSGDRILLMIFFIGLYLIFDSLIHNSKSLKLNKENSH